MDFKEKRLFIESILYIASVDNVIDDSERAFFQEIAEDLEISSDEIDNICVEIESGDKTFEEIVSEIENEETKIALIRTLVDLCHIDGKYSTDEKRGMEEICRILNVDEKELKKIEKEQVSKESKEAIKRGFGTIKSGLSFAGEKSIQGGKFVASSIASGVGKVNSKVTDALASYKKLREENKKLREELKNTTVSESAKQNIILQLNSKITSLTAELKREKERNDQNEEIIRLLQAQLEDLEKTIEVAESAKTA